MKFEDITVHITITKDNIDYISCDEDAYLISLSELRETLEDIFGNRRIRRKKRMAEYISKKKALAKFIEGDGDNDFTDGYNFAVSEYREKIKAMKSEDVQPVKRGNWVQIGEQSAKCTECGGVLKSNGIDKTGKALIFNAVYHYCPFCGARMDEYIK